MKFILLLSVTFLLISCSTNMQNVRNGMTQDDVFYKLGEPSSTQFETNNEAWLYQKHGIEISQGYGITDYWVVFDKNKKVIAVKDSGTVYLKGSRNNILNDGDDWMGGLCGSAMASGNSSAAFVHCN